MRKLILKTSLITLAGIIVLTGVVSLFVGIFSPLSFAAMFESVGSNDTSFYFYVKNYERDKDIDKLHLVLGKAITFKYDKDIVKYFELLAKENRYDDFIQFIDDSNYEAAKNIREKVFLSNEDNRLKSRYVKALATIGKKTKAFDFAAADLAANGGETLNFVFAGLEDFIKETTLDYFDNEIESKTIAEHIETKYDILMSKFRSASFADAYDRARCCKTILEMNRFMIKIVDKLTALSANDLKDDFNAVNLVFQFDIAKK